MELSYIWHDGFVARFENFAVVFDYWKDPTVGKDELPRFIQEGIPGVSLDRDKPLYVLVSHHHKDHFTNQIFRWAELFPEIHYVVSHDVMRMCRHVVSESSVYGGPKIKAGQITDLRVGQSFCDVRIAVHAFGSTDIGNSYVVEAEGNRLFHAGDLNAWVWRDDSTPGEVKMALDLFDDKMAPISEYLSGKSVDYCMFPVDSRIGSGYYEGAKLFLERIDVRRFFPMHFGLGEPEEQRRYQFDAARFCLYASRPDCEYIALQSPYSTYRGATGAKKEVGRMAHLPGL